MSTTISIKSSQKETDVLHLVKSAVDAEIIKYELSLEMSNKRLIPFEKQYNITSEYFINHFTAEDLDDGDNEYVRWAGEYKLKQRLETKLQQLRDIEYDNNRILQPN